MAKILVVDDDSHLREIVNVHLQQAGYEVIEASDGVQASLLLESDLVDLAIVDLMMPNKDGFRLSEEIRKYYDIPIIILTAKDSLIDKAKGFQAGTDDYMVKQFEPEELIFRIKALLRRFEVADKQVIKLHQTSIDKGSYEVICNNKTYMLPLKEFELLYQLASFPNRTFTREQLIEKIWGIDFDGDVRTVDVHIKRLRERFKFIANDFVIKTIRGIGYKLEVITP